MKAAPGKIKVIHVTTRHVPGSTLFQQQPAKTEERCEMKPGGLIDARLGENEMPGASQNFFPALIVMARTCTSLEAEVIPTAFVPDQ